MFLNKKKEESKETVKSQKYIFEIPEKHIEEFFSIYQYAEENRTQLNRYKLWKFIESIMPEYKNWRRFSINFENAPQPVIICTEKIK